MLTGDEVIRMWQEGYDNAQKSPGICALSLLAVSNQALRIYISFWT